ncbi:MAG: SRPBCC family protein [Bacteroidota bacterium]|nr:SRPBCC family protein [Bacteroidota bacterium]MDP4213575.1 SRPBCC family protein [Bacteroidota bacterium]MDP4249537.1 SRPBCC family protein [Bacteroidota bacterium]
MKLVIGSVIALFGIVFFLFALFPSDMSVSRVVRINAPRDSVLGVLSDLRTWSKWNTLIGGGRLEQRDKVFSLQADSNRLETENLTVLRFKTTTDSVLTRWQSASGRSFTGRYIVTESGGQVILEWSLEFHLRWYPWEKLASMFYDKQLGPLMEQSLLNLRKELEPV